MITWILTIISLVGNVLNCRKLVFGFYLWIVCNIGWAIYDYETKNYARLILDIVQTALCVYGIIKWNERK